MPKTKKLGSAKPKKAKKLDYYLDVSVNDTQFRCEAVDLSEALKNFVNSVNFPFSIKTRAFLKYGNKEVERERFYHVPEARRLFRLISSDPSALEILARKLNEDLDA